MNEQNVILELQKLARIWSDREERKITVRVEYSLRREGECSIYTLGEMVAVD